ncbi:crotonase/enoyl-CoA hydratase family protein [Vineibacter terrae]|uniref:crotonase/enoyl-CoA hydratase family protein n=1 Tax=Vineibacter terrae TaxID=2586908 RepID=UPI002E308C62|nr:crotonase/enoyl-CoA hydratase family protein [Vineibacter terrae]HEX2888448.1 crotonase/enoyl-CoA hydratase family protein [Vineibacter terrae]
MSAPKSGKILVEKSGQVTTIVLNRPDVRNACDLETLTLLREAFQAFEEDEAARVAVLTGNGGSFCAGADLKELATGRSIGFAWAGSDEGPLKRFLSKPVIAAVSGHALAAGLALAIWCDLRVADDSAVFGVFCRRWGAPMTNGATVRLPRLIGQSRALDMLLTGRAVHAEEALSIGLVNRLVPTGTARAAAEALAAEIAAFPQVCMLADRASALEQWSLPDHEAIQIEARYGQQAFRLETQAGAQRFAEGAGRHGQF